MLIEIRNATAHDIPVILELLYELGRPRPQNDRDVDEFSNLVMKYVTEDDKKILLAKFDNKIVGMASMMLLPRMNRKNPEMYIPDLIVGKEYQNKGIGKRLVESCIDFAKKNKCYRIRLESGNQRKEAHNFYRKIGFEQSALTFIKIIKKSLS